MRRPIIIVTVLVLLLLSGASGYLLLLPPSQSHTSTTTSSTSSSSRTTSFTSSTTSLLNIKLGDGGYSPTSLAIDPTSHLVYVLDNNNYALGGRLSIVNGSSKTVVGTVGVG